MRIFTAVIITAVLSIGASVGVTHSVMQERMKQEVDRVTVESFNDGFRDGSCQKGFDGFGNPCMEGVEALTLDYGPCKAMRRTEAGEILYRDMLSDVMDDGQERSTQEQVEHVKQGCRNGV